MTIGHVDDALISLALLIDTAGGGSTSAVECSVTSLISHKFLITSRNEKSYKFNEEVPVWWLVSLGKKKIVLLHFASKLKYFQMRWFSTHRKSCEVQKTTSLICSRSTNEIFSEP
jgi:hypothetical protein